LVLGQVTKHPKNPLFVPDRPWEGNYDNFYGNVVYDPEARAVRGWYLNWIEGRSALLDARSDDGVHWEQPYPGIYPYQGNKNNSIVLLGAHGASVFEDD